MLCQVLGTDAQKIGFCTQRFELSYPLNCKYHVILALSHSGGLFSKVARLEVE